MNQLNEPKMVIGSDEWCAFTSIEIPAIKARVDSGAKTSSMHAVNIQKFSHNDKQWVRFEVHPLQKNKKVTVHCEAPLIDQRVIKSSSGDKEQRPVIRIPLSLGGKSWEVEVTLTNRDSMGYRMLLGREAMNGRVLIDPEGQCLLGDRQLDELKSLYQ
ncbi:ribosomal protein S6 modification protein [Marinomonas ushuaiensis DSM 15871]|uniref:Ribosomal protein S6 modification protein n=1 Tax=Marinomonas ushuaiensis DSM 15871 TaxID=1122207 RepID=X7EB88_9GAMM|nr:ATP-dependent zinc protease [Marinomonas ushuaiensis]ETX12456.1 ribosomal protein S6 modification protein [Marinomonas ushuaiensis DSM 15871]